LSFNRAIEGVITTVTPSFTIPGIQKQIVLPPPIGIIARLSLFCKRELITSLWLSLNGYGRMLFM
jgi:hypothetical protein